MYRLSSIICLLLLGFSAVLAQSPHGEALVIDCAQCHNPSGWELELESMAFDHNDATSFVLEGLHATTDCRLCHEDLVFEGAQMDCIDCHNDIHSMTVGNDCVRCHDSNSWLVDEIPELHEANGFPLLGTHSNLSCVECHINETNLRFDRLGNECISCHNDDYLATANPSHQTVGYSTECIDCHTPLGFDWGIGSISHEFFPLELGHEIQDCNQCHTTNTFSDASPDCILCHQTDFNETANPSHTQLGLSNDCVQCHTLDLDWMPARFDIHNQFYALNGAHAEIANDCAQCHNGDYVNLPPTDCFGCHESDYNNASPNHATIGFSTDCTQCHTENEWEPSTFDHDAMYFPINSGSHQGEWNACTDCHTTPGNLSLFSCTTCHEKNETDDDHNGVNNYVYNSIDCFQCHPDGEED